MGMGTSSKGGKSRASMSEINVTPLVDVMLVLLIIFMVTAPMMQQGMEVELPKTANSGVSTPEDPFILVITKESKFFIGEVEIPMTALKTKIQAIFETRNSKEVFIQADKKVDYGTVANAMAEVKSAGISKIALITLPK